jgi:tetratricopeptide (TPR) repeat protein
MFSRAAAFRRRMPAAPGFILLLALVAAQPPAQPPVPPLPRVALETFPPTAREAVSRQLDRVAAHPSDPDGTGALGRILHAWEQWDAAHQVYQRAAALAPSTFDWRYLDAVVLQRLARNDLAEAALRTALAARADYLPARLRLAEVVLDEGDLARSEQLFTPLTSIAATEPAAEVGLGRVNAARGQHETAIRHFERAVALFPELGAAHYGLARSYRALGRAAEAERAAAAHAQYGARWPRLDDPVLASVTSLREDARASLARGVSLADSGDIKAAVDVHEAALARDPSLTQAHANLVGLYGRLGDWSRAEEHYRAAVAAGWQEAELQYDYGIVLGMQEKWDAAADAYRKALAANPLHALARNNLGQILERRRDFDGAANEYRQAVEARPTLRLARFNLGRMLLVRGQIDQAVAEFDRLQQPIDAETPRYLFALSTALVRAGRMADGRRLGSEAQRLALQFGQQDLARAIAGELSKLK